MRFPLHAEQLRYLPIPHTEITSVSEENSGVFALTPEYRFENLPPFVRVALRCYPGADSLIRIEVWLPLEWNGVFIGTGNGGMAGGITHRTLAEFLRGGYAVANTDMGTSRGADSGIDNPDVWKDFGWRATHEMTVCAKALIEAFYGKPPDYSYFSGYSTGGQQALSEAQRFPRDYDGIIAGVAANNRTHLHTYFLWNHVHLRTPAGEPLFTHDEVLQINRCAVAFHQRRGDGCPGDDFISVPASGKDEIRAFLAFLQSEIPVFSAKQLEALRSVYEGPVDPVTGKQIYNGMPIGSEIFHCGIEDAQKDEIPHYYPFIWAFGKGYDGNGFDFHHDMDLLDQKLAADLNANNPDLTPFFQNGGKIILLSGSADSCVPYPDALRYSLRVRQVVGSEEKANAFYRFYLFPGREHGVYGKGTNAVWETESGGDVLSALRRWREEGVAPRQLYAIGYHHADPAAGIRFKRPVYPFGDPLCEIPGDFADKAAVCDAEYLKR